MKRYSPQLSRRLDYAIFRMEATRGWRRLSWRVLKWWLEVGL